MSTPPATINVQDCLAGTKPQAGSSISSRRAGFLLFGDFQCQHLIHAAEETLIAYCDKAVAFWQPGADFLREQVAGERLEAVQNRHPEVAQRIRRLAGA